MRATIDNGVYSPENEKLILKTRDLIIQESLKKGSNVIVDNTHIKDKGRHFDHICSLVESLGIDAQVIEKPIYCAVEECISRDAKRAAPVGEDVIRGFWEASGGKGFQHYHPKVKTFLAATKERDVKPMVQDDSNPRAVIFDNDGTISLIHPGRSPYDASTCDQDAPHHHVIECMRLYHGAGYKILFVSGREEKDRAPTEKFYQQHFPEIEYKLFMRPTGDMRKDVIIKEEIFNNNIKDKYYVAGWFDDRLQIVRWLYKAGFPVFRVNDPEANF